jgi:L-Ala-D/L-Glu epimerase
MAMRIERVEARRIRIPFRREFSHAAKARSVGDALILSVQDERGTTGWGEIVPRPYVTGETVEEVLDAIAPPLAGALKRQTLDDVPAVMAWLEQAARSAGRNLATLCGFDLALLDLTGRRVQRPVADLLGGYVREALPAGVIVGFEIETESIARYCATLRLAGRRHVKIKVGREDDHERLRAVARVFADVPLRLDANASWTVEETIERLHRWGDVPVASIEQPVAADDLAGLARIRRETGVAVMVDESVCTMADADRIIEARAADVFNVRIGKNGGLLASRRLVERARRAGIGVHLGTMVGETGVLSRAAELFGRCTHGFVCLDGKGQNAFLLRRDVIDSVDTGKQAGRPVAHEPFGLGVRVSESALRDLQIGQARRLG